MNHFIYSFLAYLIFHLHIIRMSLVAFLFLFGDEVMYRGPFLSGVSVSVFLSGWHDAMSGGR